MANTPYIDLVKPAGTDKALISVLNANSDKIDSAVGGVQDALAIVCNGNTHGAITSGQYVYVRAHDTLQEGLYTANSNIAANATLSSSNLTANSSGGLNALNEQIGKLRGATFDAIQASTIDDFFVNFATTATTYYGSGAFVVICDWYTHATYIMNGYINNSNGVVYFTAFTYTISDSNYTVAVQNGNVYKMAI